MINKKMMCAVLCTLLTVSAVGCKEKNTVSQTTDSGMTVNSSVENIPIIDLEEAKSIALQHAGLSEKDVVFVETKLERDNSRNEYDIEFTANNVKYEYEIDAGNGNILGFSSKSISENLNDNDTGASLSSEGSEQITLDEAKTIALNHAGVTESNAVFTKAKLDYDNGIPEYDIEFIANNTEYDYEIGAKDGSILENSAKRIDDTSQTSAATIKTNEQITLDEAKTIALEHAGFSADQVIFTKSKLDYDDGTAEYEIEFKANGLEYEYTINAFTGKIIEYDVDD